jgi:hypothetical protein
MTLTHSDSEDNTTTTGHELVDGSIDGLDRAGRRRLAGRPEKDSLGADAKHRLLRRRRRFLTSVSSGCLIFVAHYIREMIVSWESGSLRGKIGRLQIKLQSQGNDGSTGYMFTLAGYGGSIYSVPVLFVQQSFFK